MKQTNVVVLIWLLIIAACAHQQVSYQADIRPIIREKCLSCHAAPDGNGYRTTGLKLYSYDDIIQGSVYGPVIFAGDSQRSVLNMLVEGRAGNVQGNLHKTGKVLTAEEIDAFRLWVEQGALNN